MASQNKFKTFLEMIKFEHTIFALPFAYLGAFLASGGVPTAANLFWITVAMVGARTAAMSLNRLIDRQIDALNPRTAARALPKGLLSVGEVWLYTIISFVILFAAAAQLNPLCVKLMPVAVFVLVIYSYTKRWTWACHFVLGIALGLAPLGSWVAVTGSIDLPGILLGLAVAVWVAGFDIIYACQDYDFDRNAGIHSVPKRFGISRALVISSVLHIFAPLLLLAVGLYAGLGIFYLVGVLAATGLLYYEHRLIRPDDLSKLGMAFMNMNGYLSTLMFVFTVLDVLL
ncbi:putative 4-hydroxybenzoate polyprenyltransferase [Metallumcola ferriviriculae]|uniref:4-hydroxybenzoate polyprenyltransferase n=1 Tax=Metallumcola ferriviriculae TaxID=3039180 RepID=A0AAU0UP37_9FIRM|nr:putative 4-hydroxybenzoate polyprenyltransferase [Desulfitibacteraceae bacterium MK1]